MPLAAPGFRFGSGFQFHGGGAGENGLLAALACLGALLPDLDAARSKIGSLHLGGGIRPFALPASAIHGAFGHRTLLHSLLGLAGASLLVGLPVVIGLGGTAGAAVVLGYGSHIMLDACTRAGVPLLWPWRKRRFHLLPKGFCITTGSDAEDAAFALLAILTAALLLPLLIAPPPGATCPVTDASTCQESTAPIAPSAFAGP